ncbi:MAG: HNH endonuclease [Acidobacteriota bacterium]|nr:HNH endonuclease [Acidobacteriota bacterium]
MALSLPKPRPKFFEKRESAAAQAKNWREMKAAVIARDGLACRVCGGKYGLDLHHLLMRSLGGRDELRNLALVCKTCHAAIHGHALRVRWTDDANRAKTVSFEWVTK